MKLNLVYNKYIDNYIETLSKVEVKLKELNVIFKSFALDNMENYGDISLVIGGDGTILKAAKFYAKWQIPVMGINIGRLGFLSEQENIEELIYSIINKAYYVEERIMLTSDNKLALNDFVIKGCNTLRSSKFYLEINHKEVCDYIADGLIISTPTGSTAYGLSAGGPILHPETNVISIVPICPHTLNARPLVIPSNELITIKTSENLLSVAIDGYDVMECFDKITIKIATQKAYLAFFKKNRFYSVLRNKLHWGISPKSQW